MVYRAIRISTLIPIVKIDQLRSYQGPWRPRVLESWKVGEQASGKGRCFCRNQRARLSRNSPNLRRGPEAVGLAAVRNWMAAGPSPNTCHPGSGKRSHRQKCLQRSGGGTRVAHHYLRQQPLQFDAPGQWVSDPHTAGWHAGVVRKYSSSTVVCVCWPDQRTSSLRASRC